MIYENCGGRLLLFDGCISSIDLLLSTPPMCAHTALVAWTWWTGHATLSRHLTGR